MLDLSNTTLSLASGGNRVVYRHPLDPTSIVKVFRARRKIKPKLTRHLHPSKRRFGPFRDSYDEYKHYLTAIYRHGHCPEYLPEFRGFVDTTQGVGHIFERVSNEGSDELAPTLKTVLETGTYDRERLVAALGSFFAEIKKDRVVFRDLMPHNLCVVHDAAGNITRIVAVDGLEDYTLIPLRSLFGFAYDWWHARTEQRILSYLDAPETT